MEGNVMFGKKKRTDIVRAQSNKKLSKRKLKKRNKRREERKTRIRKDRGI